MRDLDIGHRVDRGLTIIVFTALMLLVLWGLWWVVCTAPWWTWLCLAVVVLVAFLVGLAAEWVSDWIGGDR